MICRCGTCRKCRHRKTVADIRAQRLIYETFTPGKDEDRNERIRREAEILGPMAYTFLGSALADLK